MKRKSRERTGMFSHGRKNALRRLRAQAGWVGREKRDERREKASVYVPTNAPLNGHQNFTSAVGRRFGGDVVGGEYVVWPVLAGTRDSKPRLVNDCFYLERVGGRKSYTTTSHYFLRKRGK